MAAPFLMTNADYVWTPMTTVTLFILSLIIFLIFIKTKDVVHLTIFILNLLFSIL
ncbi:membrane protein, partial [Staphylococcus aureus]